MSQEQLSDTIEILDNMSSKTDSLLKAIGEHLTIHNKKSGEDPVAYGARFYDAVRPVGSLSIAEIKGVFNTAKEKAAQNTLIMSEFEKALETQQNLLSNMKTVMEKVQRIQT